MKPQIMDLGRIYHLTVQNFQVNAAKTDILPNQEDKSGLVRTYRYLYELFIIALRVLTFCTRM